MLDEQSVNFGISAFAIANTSVAVMKRCDILYLYSCVVKQEEA